MLFTYSFSIIKTNVAHQYECVCLHGECVCFAALKIVGKFNECCEHILIFHEQKGTELLNLRSKNEKTNMIEYLKKKLEKNET